MGLLKIHVGDYYEKIIKSMNSLLKVVIYLKDVTKPIVLTCSQKESDNREKLIKMLEDFSVGRLGTLKFDSGDVFMCTSPENIKSILITTDKNNG